MNGLGEQPGYYCYDASRPSWLPYWLDDWSESTCKLQSSVGNVAACLNPAATNCAPDSWINLNIASSQPNYDPNVSGAGIVGANQPNNAPSGIPTLNTNTAFWIAGAFAALMILTRS